MMLIDKILVRNQHVCPWWFCFTFDNPVRRWIQDPQQVLQGMAKEGETVYDIGCGMGYFSLTLARLVGPGGSVICVDMQKKMLDAARRRAERAGLAGNMTFQTCTSGSLGLTIPADFALAFWMVHEVPDKHRFFKEIRESLKKGGTLLLAEPKLHVTRQAFAASVASAIDAGFKTMTEPVITISRSVLLEKK